MLRRLACLLDVALNAAKTDKVACFEWATDGVQTEKFNLKLTFEPKNGWKFGSCDGDGTIELLGTGGERHVYTGQVDGPGARAVLKIHSKRLNETVLNWNVVVKTLTGTEFERFLHDDA